MDREGEGVSLCKALHAQAPHGRWLDITLDSTASLRKAIDALSRGCTVALSVVDMEVAEPLIVELARHLQLLPHSQAHRILLHTRCVADHACPNRKLPIMTMVNRLPTADWPAGSQGHGRLPCSPAR